jgi:redox-sensitive bicupin YhaK (pirin superfamily)
MAEPHFTMLWNEQVPRRVLEDAAGRKTEVMVVAGRFGDVAPLAPPPDSWAAQAEADVAIWTMRMEPGARCTLPTAPLAGTRRTLYFFKGARRNVGGQRGARPGGDHAGSGCRGRLVNAGDEVCEFLLLQGRPIGEPVAQYGPFVMNTQQEIAQAMQDYRRTQFGGWKFGDAAPVHGARPRASRSTRTGASRAPARRPARPCPPSAPGSHRPCAAPVRPEATNRPLA